jgi:hypothetical protein
MFALSCEHTVLNNIKKLIKMSLKLVSRENKEKKE